MTENAMTHQERLASTDPKKGFSPASKDPELNVIGNPELDWITGYFTGKNRAKRFDGFARSNDHRGDYFDARVHPESARTRACVSVEWVAFSEIAQGMKLIYVPGSISSGLRAHELLDQKNQSRQPTDIDWAASTYKAEEHLGSSVHRKVMNANKSDGLRRARIVGRLHPDAMIIPPWIREGGVRALSDHAFAGGQRYEEEDYMALWFPVIDRCGGEGLDGDPNYSRNTIWEMMRGLLIQVGEIPWRPKADMDMFDLEAHPVTLLARTEKMAEMLKYQLGKGFDPREAATALAQIFTLDDDIRSCKIPAEGVSVHPILNRRPAEELMAMDKLKTELKPILLNHCAQVMRLDDLPAEYHEAAKRKPRELTAKQRKEFKEFADGISARALDILSVKPSGELMATLARTEHSPQRLFDSHERFFEKRSQAMMFEDDLYGKLSHWERLALPFAIGATEIGLYPTAHPMATMVLTDLKRGKEGFERAQKAGAHDMNEFAGTMGRGTKDIIATNIQESEALKASLKVENPGKIVVNTPSFLRIADTIEHFRKIGGESETGPKRFIAAPGPSETSPQMRLALQMKYLDRNVDRVIFQEGWEHSNDLVQLRVRARLIQAGLIERPAGVQSALRMFNTSDLATPQTLLDDIKALTQEVKRAANANVRAPEQALALARLVTLHELLVDPTLADTEHKTTRDLVNPLTADESLTCYNREEAKIVSDEAKAILTEKAALWIPRERLEVKPDASDDADRAAAKVVQNRRMEDYIKAQDAQLGEQGLAKQRARHDEILTKSRGAQR
ncbi:MAG: hypothetical protein ACOYNL_05770 [Rickettsiales bacterium]